MGCIPWDGITVGKDRIPWEKDRQWVLFYAPAPNIFHNFVSFHPILMFLTISESGDKTNDIGYEFKTIRPNQIIKFLAVLFNIEHPAY